MTAPARSVFAEPLARARAYIKLRRITRARSEALAALDLIEQQAEEMEAEVARVKNAENGVWGVVIANRELRSKNEALQAERDRLQHLIDCAGTPLMRDVLAERDAAEQRAEGIEKALRRIAEIPAGTDDDGIYARGVALAALSAREEGDVICTHKDAELQRDPSGSVNWRCRRCGRWARWDDNTHSFTAREEAQT